MVHDLELLGQSIHPKIIKLAPFEVAVADELTVLVYTTLTVVVVSQVSLVIWLLESTEHEENPPVSPPVKEPSLDFKDVSSQLTHV